MSQPLPLFDDADDRRSIQPKRTKDDAEFKKQRKRNRKTTALPPAPAHGPCCQRCKSWSPPQDDDEFGKCTVLAVATMTNVAARIEKGTVHDWDELQRRGVTGEALHCGPGFACYAYQTLITGRDDQ